MKKFIFSTTFLAILACLLWSTAFTGIKIGLKYTTPLQFAGIRFFLSGVMILPFIPSLRIKLRQAKSQWRIILIVGLLQTTLLYALFYTGISMVPGALGAMLIGSGPLFAAIMAHLMMSNDKMSVPKVLSIITGMIGVAIISLGRKDFALSSTIPMGIGVLLLNNIVGGIGNVVVARDAKNVPPMVLSSLSMIFGGLVLTLISIPIEHPSWQIHPAEYYYALAWLSFLSAAAVTIWYSLLRREGVKVSNLNTWKFIIPVFGAWLSWTILPDEHPDLVSILGMVVIASGLLLLNYFNRKAARAAKTA